LRVAIIIAAMFLVLFGMLVGIRAVGSSSGEVAQVIEPATAAGKGPRAVAEPAEADIFFKRPVEIEEVLRIVGEENRDSLATMEGTFRAGGEEIGDSFSVPSRLETAEEIERAWARERTGFLVDMSQSMSGNVNDKLTQTDEIKEATNDPEMGESLVTKVSLQGNSTEVGLLPARQSEAIKNISVITRSDILEMFERARKEAKRRGEPPPKFD
jgi:hypothetical protein